MRFPTNNWLFILVFSLILIGLAGLGSAQTNISNSSSWFSTCPRITVDPVGNVHVVWAEYYTMNGNFPSSGDAFYAKYNISTKQWSTPLNLSNSGQCFSGEWYSVGIDADGSGNVYAVYIDGPSLKLRILSNGSWGSPFDVATAGGAGLESARVAVDAAGDIFVVCGYGGVVYSRARVGGVWENATILTYPGTVSKFPNISVGTNQVYCVFEDNHFVPTQYNAVYVRRAKTYGAAWSSSQRLTSAGESEECPAVKVDANDVAHVVLTPYFASGIRDVRYVEGTSSGFSAPVILCNQGGVHYPSLTGRGTNVYACWQSYGLHYRNRVDGSWAAEAAVPNSSVHDLSDVATSPSQDKIYYVADTSSNDIYFYELAGPGPLEPPITEYWIGVGQMNGDGRMDFLATWSDSGLYFRDSMSASWERITAPATQFTAGDLDGDKIDDLIGMWPNNPGVFVRFSSTGTWAQVVVQKPTWMSVGDMNGDGRTEVLGNWIEAGVYFADPVRLTWERITSPATQITACDLDGDGKDDLIGMWPEAPGVLARLSSSGTWVRLAWQNPDWISVGDMNGDGRTDFLGSWPEAGVYFRDSRSGTWVQITSPATQITAGDLDGDGKDDLIGVWPGDPRIMARLSHDGTWLQLDSGLRLQGLTRDKIGSEINTMVGGQKPLITLHSGGRVGYSPLFGYYEDLSINAPQLDRVPDRIDGEMDIKKIDEERQRRIVPGPGEAGFRPIVEQASPYPIEKKRQN